MTSRPWRISADTGGTFTDCLAIAPDGTHRRVKVLSTGTLRGSIVSANGRRVVIHQSWGAQSDLLRGATFHHLRSGERVRIASCDPATNTVELEEPLEGAEQSGEPFEVSFGVEAPVLAARLATGTPAGEALPPIALRVATTRGTNALLERRGTAPALFVTEGFGDLLEIGTQARTHLFTLGIRKPLPLHECVVEVEERLDASGNVLRPLDEERLREEAQRIRATGFRSAAVALLHSYLNPAHELRAEEILREEGFEHVAISSRLSPTQRILPRAQTAVVEAYLASVIESFVRNVREGIGEGTLASLHVMTSAGGLQVPGAFHAKDSLLSGPAGGVVGAAASATEHAIDAIVAFDMGGTSTDVSRWDGALPYVFEHRVGDAHLVAPALAIETVAAGGGSICSFDGYRLRVGPESAGASPGPACYGAGGPLAITDVNLLLGRLDPARFGIPVDREAARARLDEVRAQLPEPMSAERVLEGFLAIANERMAEAVRRVSVREGYRPSGYTLLAFGGAGGQHACELAELLGMTRVLVPAEASLLSAVGLRHAAIERFAERDLHAPLDEFANGLDPLFDELAGEALDALQTGEAALEHPPRVTRRMASLRLQGQEVSLTLDLAPGDDPRAAFIERYRAQYGYDPGDRALEVESLRVAVASAPPESHRGRIGETTPSPNAAEETVRAYAGGRWSDVPVYDLSNGVPSATIAGPCLIHGLHTTCFVPEGWCGSVREDRSLLLERGERE